VSKTTPAEYHGFCFWVFDVCASILFAEMATVARETPAARALLMAGRLAGRGTITAQQARPASSGRTRQREEPT